LLPYERVELVGEFSRQSQGSDQLLNVAEVLEPPRVRHARSELQLDQRGEFKKAYSFDFNAGFGGVGEGFGVRLSITGVIGRGEKLDADAGVRITQMLAPLERG